MTILSKLSYLNSAPFLRKFHGGMTLVWLLMFPITLFTGLRTSVMFIVFLSIYANFVSQWAAWQAARVEVKADNLEVNAQTAEVSADAVTVESLPVTKKRRRRSPSTDS